MADAASQPQRSSGSPAPPPSAEAPPAEPSRRWRDDLRSWAIPEEIRRAVDTSPWELPQSVFASRARLQLRDPGGESHRRAAEALPAAGVVLDVGCGAGAGSLPLRPGEAIGVDENPDMLSRFSSLAVSVGVASRVVPGRWPDVAGRAPIADVVVCHHVLYNVADLAPFIHALTEHARWRVVVEVTASHPLSALNPLWTRLHGLKRPDRPTAADAYAAIRALGLDACFEAWSRPAASDFATFDEMVDVTARRLCLPRSRRAELVRALGDLGVDESASRLGPEERRLVTIWWDGSAGPT